MKMNIEIKTMNLYFNGILLYTVLLNIVKMFNKTGRSI